MKSNKEIVEGCNKLAQQFYLMMGCREADDFKFYDAHHPQEELCWSQAVLAYDHIEGTDVISALDEMREDEGD